MAFTPRSLKCDLIKNWPLPLRRYESAALLLDVDRMPVLHDGKVNQQHLGDEEFGRLYDYSCEKAQGLVGMPTSNSLEMRAFFPTVSHHKSRFNAYLSR